MTLRTHKDLVSMTPTDHNRGHTVVPRVSRASNTTTATPLQETSIWGISRGREEVTCPEKELVTRSRVLNVDSSASRLEGDAGSLQASTDNWGKTCVRLANIHFGGLQSGQNIYWHVK